jgi:hypothetical protein
MGYVFIVFVAFCCFCCIGRRKNNTKQHNATLEFQRITLNVNRLQQKQRKQQQIVVSLQQQHPFSSSVALLRQILDTV